MPFLPCFDMTKEKILSTLNLTLLRAAGGDEITALCDNALDFGCASVCVPPCYVKYAAEYVNKAIPISTIIGFPFGFETTESKCFQAENAISNGASEIDIMINLGRFESKDYGYVINEIRSVKKVCGNKPLKVVVEIPQLTLDNKLRACNLVSESGADYIKTSTLFSDYTATETDISLLSDFIKNGIGIEATGKILYPTQAETLLFCGATRIGTSDRIIQIMKSRSSKNTVKE